MYEKVENHPGLARDMNSSGIVSVDNQALLAYKKRKRSMTRWCGGVENWNERDKTTPF